MMVNCPYLIYEASHCASCTGWSCNVFGRKKRLSDTSMCIVNEEWIECPRYLQKVPAAKVSDPIPTISFQKVDPVTKEPEPEVEEEVIELPPTEEVTSVSGGDVETIKVTLEPESVELEVPPPTPSTDCPYFEADTVGMTCCSGFHCRAINVPLRAFKICKSPPSWHECGRFLKAIRLGVK